MVMRDFFLSTVTGGEQSEQIGTDRLLDVRSTYRDIHRGRTSVPNITVCGGEVRIASLMYATKRIW
jgi:hypothetical protein